MRRPALALALTCLSIACRVPDEGGGTDAGIDAGRRDAGPRDAAGDAPDADPRCHVDCFGGYFCLDGVIHASERRPIPCSEWTGECRHWPTTSTCMRGCREGLSADRPEDVCEENVPKREGDPCAAPEHCAPGERIVDAFGGTTELALDCDLAFGICVRRPVEICDGSDDEDADGSVDEGCTITPAIVATPSTTGTWRDVSFARDRIALLTDATLVIVDPDGAVIRARAFAGAHRVERIAEGFAVLWHTAYGTAPDEIVVLRDDGTERVLAIASPPDTRYAELVPIGTDWLVIGVDGGAELEVQSRDGATGARIGTTSFAPSWPWTQHAPLGADVLLLASRSTEIERHRATRDPVVTPIGTRTARITGWLSEPLVRGSEILITSTVYGGWSRVVRRIDGTTGEWLGEIPLGEWIHDGPVPIASAGDDLLVSWLGEDGMLRTVVVDDAGTRVGTSAIPIGTDAGAGVFAGETDRGPRVVLGTSDGWIVIAPAIR